MLFKGGLIYFCLKTCKELFFLRFLAKASHLGFPLFVVSHCNLHSGRQSLDLEEAFSATELSEVWQKITERRRPFWTDVGSAPNLQCHNTDIINKPVFSWYSYSDARHLAHTGRFWQHQKKEEEARHRNEY